MAVTEILEVVGQIAYDGTNYAGFQYQPRQPTIQGALEQALESCSTTLPRRVVGAGRTDTGVHARGQVVHAAVKWRHGVETLQRAWNASLPADIVIRQLQAAPVEFHPRFSALSRTYRYQILQQRAGPQLRKWPLGDRFSFYVSGELDIEAMNQAASTLLGEHDFSTFGQPPQGENTVRRLDMAEWQVIESPFYLDHLLEPRLVCFTVTANGFLHRMVRNLVGTLLEVGKGCWQVADVTAARQARDRSRSAPPAPARGLTLEAVTYPAEFVLFSSKE